MVVLLGMEMVLSTLCILVLEDFEIQGSTIPSLFWNPGKCISQPLQALPSVVVVLGTDDVCHVAKLPLTLGVLEMVEFCSQSERVMGKTNIIYKWLFAPSSAGN